MEYLVWEGNLQKIQEKAEKIAAKCAQYGCEFNFEIIGEEWRRNEKAEIWHYYVIEAEGIARCGDWELLGSITHLPEGNIIMSFTGVELPDSYKTCKPRCEHCNTTRARSITFVVLNNDTGELKQVGSTCLHDYTGIDIDAAMSVKNLFDDLSAADELEEAFGFGFKANPYKWLTTFDAVCVAFDVISKQGYVKRNNETGTPATADVVLAEAAITANVGEAKKRFETKAKAAIEWAKSLDREQSEYINNLSVLASSEYVEAKHLGILVSLIPAYERANPAKNANTYVGEIGERLTVSVANGLRPVTSYMTEWGRTFVYVFEDAEGHAFCWKTATEVKEPEAIKRLKGTVKMHKDFAGRAQTELTRCKAL